MEEFRLSALRVKCDIQLVLNCDERYLKAVFSLVCAIHCCLYERMPLAISTMIARHLSDIRMLSRVKENNPPSIMNLDHDQLRVGS